MIHKLVRIISHEPRRVFFFFYKRPNTDAPSLFFLLKTLKHLPFYQDCVESSLPVQVVNKTRLTWR